MTKYGIGKTVKKLNITLIDFFKISKYHHYFVNPK